MKSLKAFTVGQNLVPNAICYNTNKDQVQFMISNEYRVPDETYLVKSLFVFSEVIGGENMNLAVF